MPTNLYVPTNYFDLLSGHILAASLLVKIDAAVRDGRDTVEIWSSKRATAPRVSAFRRLGRRSGLLDDGPRRSRSISAPAPT
jgi:hypothetical protein